MSAITLEYGSCTAYDYIHQMYTATTREEVDSVLSEMDADTNGDWVEFMNKSHLRDVTRLSAVVEKLYNAFDGQVRRESDADNFDSLIQARDNLEFSYTPKVDIVFDGLPSRGRSESHECNIIVADNGAGVSKTDFVEQLLNPYESKSASESFTQGEHGIGSHLTHQYSYRGIQLILTSHPDEDVYTGTVIRENKDGNKTTYEYYTLFNSIPMFKEEFTLESGEVLESGLVTKVYDYKFLNEQDNLTRPLDVCSSPFLRRLDREVPNPVFPVTIHEKRGNKSKSVEYPGFSGFTQEYPDLFTYMDSEEFLCTFNSQDLGGSVVRDVVVAGANPEDSDYPQEIIDSFNARFPDSYESYPHIVFTVNGQRHASWTEAELKKCGLESLAGDSLVVFELANLDLNLSDVFTTARDGFKDSEEALKVKNMIRGILRKDTTLQEIAEKKSKYKNLSPTYSPDMFIADSKTYMVSGDSTEIQFETDSNKDYLEEFVEISIEPQKFDLESVDVVESTITLTIDTSSLYKSKHLNVVLEDTQNETKLKEIVELVSDKASAESTGTGEGPEGGETDETALKLSEQDSDNSKQSEEAMNIISSLVPEIPTEMEGYDCVMEMKNGGGRNWRQTEWVGWYLEYVADNTLDGGKTEYYGNTEFDYEDEFVWDFKTHSIDTNWSILNDCEATKQLIEDQGGFGFIILHGESEKESDRHEMKAWHKGLKGQIPDFDEKTSDMKTNFTPLSFDAYYIDSMKHIHNGMGDWVNLFQEGMSNSNGNLRKGKFKVNPDKIPDKFQVASVELDS